MDRTASPLNPPTEVLTNDDLRSLLSPRPGTPIGDPSASELWEDSDRDDLDSSTQPAMRLACRH